MSPHPVAGRRVGRRPLPLMVATTNRHKWREIRELLQGVPVELLSLRDVNPIEAPQETGTTFAENARAKATYYRAASGLTVVAEDSGLEIDELGGEPGVESARWGGPDATYPEKFALVYDALRSRGKTSSTARFVCALALAGPDGMWFEARGTIEGRIAPEPRGAGGFGYDPIFFYPPFEMTLAEAGERKAEVSHRAVAFRSLGAFLIERFRAGPSSKV